MRAAMAEDKSDKAPKQVLVMGGPKSLVDGNFARKLAGCGLKVVWHAAKESEYKGIPVGCDGVILLKDFCSHKLQEMAKPDAVKRHLPFAVIPSQFAKAATILEQSGLVDPDPEPTQASPPTVHKPLRQVRHVPSAPWTSTDAACRLAIRSVLEDTPEAMLDPRTLRTKAETLLAADEKVDDPDSCVRQVVAEFQQNLVVTPDMVGAWLRRLHGQAKMAGKAPPSKTAIDDLARQLFGKPAEPGAVCLARATVHGGWALHLLSVGQADNWLAENCHRLSVPFPAGGARALIERGLVKALPGSGPTPWWTGVPTLQTWLAEQVSTDAPELDRLRSEVRALQSRLEERLPTTETVHDPWGMLQNLVEILGVELTIRRSPKKPGG